MEDALRSILDTSITGLESESAPSATDDRSSFLLLFQLLQVHFLRGVQSRLFSCLMSRTNEKRDGLSLELCFTTDRSVVGLVDTTTLLGSTVTCTVRSTISVCGELDIDTDPQRAGWRVEFRTLWITKFYGRDL